jgi:uncharacterized protein YjbI with pentapeptide repeats
MNIPSLKSIPELLSAYTNGQRQFNGWHFEEDESVRGLDLTGVEFRNCFLYLDFRDANLTNARFISCNMKTADFRGANLTNALIKNCLLESAMFKGAIVDNFRFEENYYWGMTTQPGDFERVFKEADEA